MFVYDRRAVSVADCVPVENLTGDVKRMKIGRFGLWYAVDSMAQDCLENEKLSKFRENIGTF